MKLLSNKRKKLFLNITPLIDVLFILVIFFAVSSTFLEQPGVKLELPKTSTSELEKVEKAILFITKDKKIYFMNKQVTQEMLPQLIKEAMENSLDKTLFISADKNVPHGMVVEIMDLARQNKVEKLVISTEPKINE